MRARGQGCGRDVLGGAVYLEFGGGQSRYQGLATCGSVWACPVCSPKIGATRAHEVQKALAWARAQGLHVVLLTSTVRHGRKDSLLELRKQVSGAWRRLRSSRAWREGVGSMIEHSIKATEVTHGANGWHPHAHSLLFVRASSGEAGRLAVARAAALWVDAVTKVGGRSLEGPGWDVKLVDPGSDVVLSQYVAKWGRPPTDLELEHASVRVERRASFELALGASKRIGKGLGWMDLLELAAEGDARARDLFGEYETAMAGVQALVFSDGLRALAGVEELSEDEARAKAEALESFELEGVAFIPRGTWARLVRDRETYWLLVAARGGYLELERWFTSRYGSLVSLGIELELGSPF